MAHMPRIRVLPPPSTPEAEGTSPTNGRARTGEETGFGAAPRPSWTSAPTRSPRAGWTAPRRVGRWLLATALASVAGLAVWNRRPLDEGVAAEDAPPLDVPPPPETTPPPSPPPEAVPAAPRVPETPASHPEPSAKRKPPSTDPSFVRRDELARWLGDPAPHHPSKAATGVPRVTADAYCRARGATLPRAAEVTPWSDENAPRWMWVAEGRHRSDGWTETGGEASTGTGFACARSR